MAPFFSVQSLLTLFLCVLPFATPFTVISDSGTPPPALIDGPQSGFSMNKNRARTDAHEQEAVYDIMRATGNDWATEIPDVCRGRWHGIECMPDKDNVYHVVSLMFGALSDDTAFSNIHNPQPIPAFLGRLGPTLQTLVLRENGHVGPIPSELGNLNRLRVLDLHKNNLNGSIPFSLGRITGLRSLDLSGNRLTGSIPGLTFPVLNVMDLSQNLLNGSIPSGLGTCHSLIKIDFSHNRLIGSIPDSFDGLKELILIDLSYNRLSNPFPISLKKLNSLQTLILKDNQMGSITIPNDSFEGPLPFERELVWRMKRKLRLYNNSGLCYKAKNGFEDGLDSSINSGIGLCETGRPIPGRSVQHLSALDEGEGKIKNNKQIKWRNS
ncbi:hypothetical protein Patl1_34540 [Pistacia atlantica]|uniref:Uncharacterized protein n=1 Tax=Pistacia atlantica TaxID=434234 RepID=A0ACC0ZT53_9ROSI|nr:hypothetical protein Patl1_34540 [Pistacia atlantica]